MMAILRILLIFACIWLLFVLAWRQLRVFVSGAGTSGDKYRKSKQAKTRTSGSTRSSTIPDDVGSYVDYTEIK